MTGIASGLAHLGLIPITYTIATFNTIRCLEQIKLDVCYPNLPVIIVGTGAGLSYSSLGSTHHSIEDIALLRSIPNLSILCPSDPEEVKKLLDDAIKLNGPVYLRLGKKNEPVVESRRKIGKSNIIVNGKNNLIISVGNILIEAINASKKLKRAKIENSVIDLRYIKPLEGKVLKTAFKKFKRIFVIEEHFINGGAGSSIIEWANKNGYDANKINFLSETAVEDIMGDPNNATNYEFSQQCTKNYSTSGTLAEKAKSNKSLVCACLLHDYGHFILDEPNDLVIKNLDGKHEEIGYQYLQKLNNVSRFAINFNLFLRIY
mgnify:CR=1 FL=1